MRLGGDMGVLPMHRTSLSLFVTFYIKEMTFGPYGDNWVCLSKVFGVPKSLIDHFSHWKWKDHFGVFPSEKTIFSILDMPLDTPRMWLDSCYPTDDYCSKAGVRRGMCPGGEDSAPQQVRQKFPSAYVTFANVAFGEIGSTQSVYPSTPPAPPATQAPTATTSTGSGGFLSSTTTTSVATSNGGNCEGAWEQCGGQNFDGPTCCDNGYTCTVQSQWYSQCKWTSKRSTELVPWFKVQNWDAWPEKEL